MFLSLNKKKLKELSSNKLSHSQTIYIAGATGTDDPSLPSKTTGFKCVVEGLPGKFSKKVES
ncbi:hypothetical protein D9981_02795 [Pseudoalteromonas phenolica O-BC30]|uniref:Uncharacterized protein n=1 Tax=Pseudoalteromonas phenolica TaxID=161398 RepID=A0A0S2K8Q1_9GAMM|nr:hypothetical protein PP2015_4081 [Pseudoalteromonas phenolica]MBE0357578.1 hypothetical protein [Pseudoalteromonas phenolica O-BC30]RXF05391.1 hypothetical protein D9981_02795 [Pseudoalteromonas phenolica O-BC30]